MDNCRLEHHQSCVNISPTIVSKPVIVETWKQHVGVRVIQSLDASITNTRVETLVAPKIYTIKRGVLIGSIIKLGIGSSGILTIRNLSWSSALLAVTTRVVGTPQMMFKNPRMTTHVNRIVNGQVMNSITTRRYRNGNATNPRGGYLKTIYYNYTNSWSYIWPLCYAKEGSS